ncbi:MAG: hypothetical protein FJ253_02040, partial [Phycisphaerae bacterium]|nr:hypothetical protein [Phycisphaerae bacterium]
MSKITKVRITQLAKELGVTTKDIIEKCKAEEIPGVDKPQATVSAGLALTIREWFGGSSAATAVERAEKVDVEEARARAEKAPRKSSRKSAVGAGTDAAADGGGTATVVEGTPVAPKTRRSPPRRATEPPTEDGVSIDAPAKSAPAAPAA